MLLINHYNVMSALQYACVCGYCQFPYLLDLKNVRDLICPNLPEYILYKFICSNSTA